MKHFLKGAAAFLITMAGNIIINVICNMQGIDLNSTAQTMGTVFVALAIYHALIRNETGKDDKKQEG